MVYEFHGLTDTGRLRSNNEDAIACEPDLGLALLADGMGGYQAGEVASAMATGTVSATLGTWLLGKRAKTNTRDIVSAMRQSVDQANLAIFQASIDNPQFTGMGTTLVMAVFCGARALVGHIGDSRCYRWREGRLEQLTRDHSLLQEQVDAGLLTPEQAEHAPHRNLVTRALGVESAVALDVAEHAVLPGDLYLLCSDGLTDMLRHEGMQHLLRAPGATPALDTLAQALVDGANAAGGRDNISVILVRATGGQKRGLLSRWLPH